MRRRQIGYARGGVPVNAFFVESPSGVRAAFAEYGARVVYIEAPDRFGRRSRIFGPRGDLESVHSLEALGEAGATHCALAGVHPEGPAHSVWWGGALADGVRFHYESPAGEEGRSAAVECSVAFRLDARGALSVHHSARCSQPGRRASIDLVTPLAFDLHDRSATAVQHREIEVQIESAEISEADARGEATGHLRRVGGTPLDRRDRTAVLLRKNESTPPIDYVLRASSEQPAHVATASERRSGRRVDLETDRPVLRLEVAGRLDDTMPTLGLWPRNFAGADRHSHFPTTLAETGTSSTTIYRFGLEA